MAIALNASGPARSDRAVVFAADGNYLPYALVAASQLARLAPGRDFDICLCSTETLALPASLAPLGLRLCRVETGAIFDGLRLDARRSPSAYLRLALPAAFEGCYRRLVYLDSDVFIQGGDFPALMAVDIGGHAVAAVRDNTQWRTPGRRPEQFRRLGWPSARYFNSGMQLIDVEAFNERGLLARCLDFGERNKGRLVGHDQTLLNCVLRGEWAELSPRWNWQYTWASRLFETMEDANVVHFIGPKKPWNHAGGELPLRFRRAYRAFLAEHFPDVPPISPDGPPPHRDPAFLRRMLLKHVIATSRTCAYLDRFETDLTVYK